MELQNLVVNKQFVAAPTGTCLPHPPIDKDATLSDCTCVCVCVCVCVFCAIKLEPTYSNPNRAFKVSEIYKEYFYLIHSLTEFPRPS